MLYELAFWFLALFILILCVLDFVESRWRY